MLILLAQAGDIGLDDLVGLGVQGAARIPIGEEQQRRHRYGEQQHIDKNDAKSLGAKEPEGPRATSSAVYRARIM